MAAWADGATHNSTHDDSGAEDREEDRAATGADGDSVGEMSRMPVRTTASDAVAAPNQETCPGTKSPRYSILSLGTQCVRAK